MSGDRCVYCGGPLPYGGCVATPACDACLDPLEPVKCSHCGEREAVCMGAYEGAEELSPACGACCAHGNEDGRCEPIGFASWAEWYEAQDAAVAAERGM